MKVNDWTLDREEGQVWGVRHTDVPSRQTWCTRLRKLVCYLNSTQRVFMPELVSVATAVPPHRVDAADVKAELNARLPSAAAARLCRIVDGTRIQRRYTVAPIGDLLRLGTVQARNDEYVRHTLALGETVARSALADADVDPGSTAALISVSCTGYMMPSLDAHLIGRLGLPATARRIPITELGCSAGVAAVGLAATLLAQAPTGIALVVSVELSSLGVQLAEPSKTDMLGNVLFGDGAGAAVLARNGSGRGPEVLASRSVLWSETLDHLGMRLTDTGLRLVLSAALPRVVQAQIRPMLANLLALHRLVLDDITFWVVHPGGPKILEAVAEGLTLPDRALQASWEVWERFGNLSSANVFFILRHLQESARPSPGDLGIMLAFGPGVTCEAVLLRAGGWLSRQP